jgi:hypothetical protein
MHTSKNRSQFVIAPRSYDQESGMNRTSRPTRSNTISKTPRHREPSPESEQDGTQTDSSVQAYLQKEDKDDSRRSRPAEKAPNLRDRNTRPTNAPEEADEQEIIIQPEQPVSKNGYLTVMSMAYRIGFTHESYPAISRIIPDTSAMFDVLFEMCSTVQENSLIHEHIPAYTSLGMYLYYAHVVHFHILRVIASEDELSRVERRILRSYESIGPPESWPIAAPLVPFIHALGKCTVTGGKYGTIVPKFPNYESLKHATESGLTQVHTVAGIARLPVVPALQEFLFRYSTNTTVYDDATLYPTTPTLSATNQFVSLRSSSSVSAPFQTLALSAGWKQPKETGHDVYSAIDSQKQFVLQKWEIPEIGNSKQFVDHETFLGLEDKQKKRWIKQLLIISSGFNRFFKGGVTLDTIPVITIEESYSKVTFDITDATKRVTTANQKWYFKRENLTFDLEGTILRETSQANLQIASATAPRRIYGNNTMPTNPAIPTVFSPEETGPFFSQTESPRVEIEGFKQPDPLEQVSTTIQSRVYNNQGNS